MATRYGPGVALVVTDLQNDFAAPGGSLYVAGGEDIIAGVNREIAAAASAGSPVFYTQDWHPPSTPHFVTEGGIWPPHCVRDTPGARLHPDLTVAGEVIRKGVDGRDGYSGFSVRDPRSGERSATVLGERLAAGSVRTVVVVGLAGDYCVLETALDARALGLEVTLPLELTRFVELAEGDRERAITRMVGAGVRVEGLTARGGG
ncbi:isochorismatase family protein [Frankia sp. Mgl5]|uniref:isochorismatase family protein n=1 Tax=Frankia sp. Mgl5 TaxID=2933793 RepID=UPI00200BC013|nr:isochorismatase family protein [Frankia sp. Mgl5]MCK9928230.1 isochorismatase family protein [Frankia sp. Mgl5]